MNEARTSRLFTGSCLLIALVCGVWAATQFLAWKLHFHPVLGWNIHGVYPPWGIVGWFAEGGDRAAPHLFRSAVMTGLITTLCLMIAFIIGKTVSQNTSRALETLHGSARWANRTDIEEAGFLKNEGVFIGGWKDPKTEVCSYLRFQGNLHILALAPTRSGKGVCLVLPTLATWPQSCVVTDIKGELWALTATWRQQYAKQKVLRFEPAAPQGSVKWNPLDEIRLGTEYETGDVQNLAGTLVDPTGKGLDDSGTSGHFTKLARSLMTGLIVHVLYRRKKTGEPASLAGIGSLFKGNILQDAFWEQLRVYEHIEGEKGTWRPHPLVVQSADDIISTPEKERGSVLTTTKNVLSLYRDPILAENTAYSEFHISDLMDHDSPVTLYLITNPTDKIRLAPLFRIFIVMSCHLLAPKMEFVMQESGDVRAVSRHKHKLLMMLDEFPAWGKLDIVEESLAFLAGYGIFFYLIAQDMEQIVKIYGEHQTITSNTHIQIVFAPHTQRSVKYASEMTGVTTIIKPQVTTSGSRMGPFQKQVSTTWQESRRQLLTEDEVMRMPKARMDGDTMLEGGDMLVFMAGLPAIYGKQMPYFLDPVLKARTCIMPPENTDRIIESRMQPVNLEQAENTCKGIL